MASTDFLNPSTFGPSNINWLYTNLPAHLQAVLAQISTYLGQVLSTAAPSYQKYLAYSLELVAGISPEILIASVFAPILILVFAMASWRSYLGGRYSPFGVSQTRSPPHVTEDDYHYLGPDDFVENSGPRPSHLPGDGYFPRQASRSDAANPNIPDILVLKHKTRTFPLHFPAYSIGEGLLSVGELRRLAAEKTETSDPRRIKLLYKGKTLKDDSLPCREEGLKQNSELLCVISEPPPNGFRLNEDSSDSASESDMLRADREANGAGPGGVRIDVDGTIIRDNPTQKKSRKGHRGGRKKRREDPSNTMASHLNAQIDSKNSSTANTSRSNTPAQPQRPSSSTMERLESLSSVFHTQFLPQCVLFANNPPNDPKVRNFEYKKLSEMILAQIILKLDEVQTEGDEEARARRRALVKETQDWLARLDKAVKT